MKEFTTKQDLNTKKQALFTSLLPKNEKFELFSINKSSYKNIYCIKAKYFFIKLVVLLSWLRYHFHSAFTPAGM